LFSRTGSLPGPYLIFFVIAMNKCFITLAILVCCFTAGAQQPVSGTVTDEKRIPLSFVSVTLSLDSVVLSSATTSEKGGFEILVHTGREYIIRCSLVGYETFTRRFRYPDTAFLSAIQLSPAGNLLANVTVTANRPLVTRSADRFTIHVENSFLANGNNALDVLQRSPGLSVDYNGVIRIRGAQGVTVMINNLVQRMSGEELAEYLRTLRSEDILKIEVIPNPPAEYEASGTGGIVHIVLKQARKDGINGTISAQYRRQARRALMASSVSADYKKEKLYLQFGASVVSDQNTSTGWNSDRFANGNFFYSSVLRNNDNLRQFYRFGAAYDISAKQSVSMLATYNDVWMDHDFYSNVEQGNANTKINGTNTTNWLRNPAQGGVSTMYSLKTDTLGSLLKLIAEYTSGTRDDANTYSALYTDHSLDAMRATYTYHRTDIITVQADHLQVLDKRSMLRFGAKYAGIDRNNDVRVEDIINDSAIVNPASNQFKYKEQLLMAYIAAERTFGRTSLKLGLRGEQTFSKGNSITGGSSFDRSYFGLFPSVFLNHSLGEKHPGTVYASYSRRLSRPGFNELNPYRMQLNAANMIIGNPDLQPEFTHKFDLGYQSQKGFTVNLFYTLSTGVIRQLAIPKGNLLEQQYQNIDDNRNYGINIEAPFTILKGWTTQNSMTILYSDYQTSLFRNRSAAFSVRQVQSIRIPSFVDIDMIADYRSPSVNGSARVSDIFYFDIGFTRRVLKSKGRLRLFFSDIFNNTREQERSVYQGAQTEFYQKRQTQNISLSFSYNFSIGKTFNNKNLEQGSSEEKNRL
jgi:iron complex outermembrane receptor protein